MPSADLISLFVTPLDRIGVPYMVTGAVAAIIYGEPRLTNDVDIVIALAAEDVPRLRALFAGPDFYVPSVEVVVEELARTRDGHFNVIHVPTATKADFYPVGDDPLHQWAMSRRRHVSITGAEISVAPPEYVVVRKLEYLRAGGSDKHRTDVRAMLRVLGEELDTGFIGAEVGRRGLEAEWRAVMTASS